MNCRKPGSRRTTGDFVPYGLAPEIWEEGVRNLQALREELVRMQERLVQLEAELDGNVPLEAQSTQSNDRSRGAGTSSQETTKPNSTREKNGGKE